MVGEAVEEIQAPGQVERCIEGARSQTWEARVELTTQVIERLLAEKSSAPSPATVGVA